MYSSATIIPGQPHAAISGASGPNSQTIVFINELGSDPAQWQLLAPALEDRYQIVQLTLPGPTTPDPPALCHTLDSHANNLLAGLRTLALHDVMVVGHGVGALIGLLAAIREPRRCARLILIAPSPRRRAGTERADIEPADINELLAAMEGDYHGWSETRASLTLGGQGQQPELIPELVMALTNSFVRTNPEIARHFARVPFLADSRPERPFLSLPTLIVQAAHDAIAPLAVGHYLNEQLADSRLVLVETIGHRPQISAPRETLAAITTFLSRVII